ncbi:MAG TPA: tetratricopeptide repeat protein [Candidatus Acidoferrum sp.]|nr:tetratricopeptide repeat protein [Candidatus Acidoferrum sp.]
MKFPSLSGTRTVASRGSRANQILIVTLLFGFAQNFGAPRTQAWGPGSQSTQQKPAQTRTQKLSNPLNDLLDEAQRDIDSNQFEAAVVPLQRFIGEKPDVAWAHFQLAYAYTALKKTDEARAEYERATALDPKMAEAFLNLGIMLTEKDPAAAVPPLRRAVELLPSQSRPRFLLGYALERSGDVTGSVEAYEEALRLDPRDAETVVHLGNLYLGLKRYAKAEAKFRAAIESQPKSPQALLGLAQSLDGEKKPEAANAFRDYLAVQPDGSAARARLIHLLLEQKQYDAALAELDRADDGKTPTLDSLRSRADIQIAQKKWDDSIVTLRKAIELAPGDAILHGGLGRVYMQKRDFASAEKEIKTALKIDGNNLSYWKDLMSTYYLGRNYQATLAALDVIAKSETPGAGEWFIRALCYDSLNQPKPALEAYQKFLELDQDRNPDQVWQAQQRSKVLRRMLDQKR